jgi:hypothetical protein
VRPSKSGVQASSTSSTAVRATLAGSRRLRLAGMPDWCQWGRHRLVAAGRLLGNTNNDLANRRSDDDMDDRNFDSRRHGLAC